MFHKSHRLFVSILTVSVLFVWQQRLLWAEDWPEMIIPPSSNVQWVGKDMVQNGVPMQIQSFSSDSGVADVLAYYRDNWNTGSKFQAVENNVGDWQIIGKQVGDYMLTVQVKNGSTSSSEGYMAISKLPVFDGDSKLDESFPRLGGTSVVSDTRSNDDGKKAKTLILQNSYSVQSNISFYEANLPSKGWQKRQSRPSGKSDVPGHVMYFERSGEACHIVINQDRNGKTVTLVNLSNNHL